LLVAPAAEHDCCVASPSRILERARRRSAQPRDRQFPVKKRPRQQRSRTTFDAIVEAAALTTEYIASAAGVAIGSIYEYFASKEAVVAEVVRRMLADMFLELEDSHASIGEGPEAWLRGWLHAIFAAVRKRKELIRTLAYDVPFLDEIEEVRRLPMTLVSIAAKSPREVLAIPYVSPASIFLITAMVRSAVLEGVIDPPEGPSSEEIEDTLVHMLLVLLRDGLSEQRRKRA
jgi:AcrR family transcriptional regulator